MQAESIAELERAGGGAIVGDDRLGVSGAVAVDVLDRVLEGVDDAHREDQREELLGPVGLGRRRDDGSIARTRSSPRSSTPRSRSAASAPRQERGGDVGVHEQRLGRVADARGAGPWR